MNTRGDFFGASECDLTTVSWIRMDHTIIHTNMIVYATCHLPLAVQKITRQYNAFFPGFAVKPGHGAASVGQSSRPKAARPQDGGCGQEATLQQAR